LPSDFLRTRGFEHMRILVTGGAGYVGSHAVKLLVARRHEVIVVDNLSAGHRAAVPSGELVVADLTDRQKIADLLRTRRIDAVMHFAALAYVGESVREPARYYQNNVVGTLALLEAMREAGVAKIVFSSTCATYGVPREVPIPEQHPQQPINPYGCTKLAIEWALDDYRAAYGLGFAALRYFNAAGAALDGSLGEDHTPETHLIPIALEVAEGKRVAIDIFGTDYPTPDGTCIRDYIHVDDLATAHLAALERLAPGDALKVNLGTGCGASVRQVIDVCRRVTGREIATRESPRRPGDPPELVACPAAALEQLGWQAEHSELETIVTTAWNWFAAHPERYADGNRR
jgi:UDP-glucose 4-epimerase